MSLLEKLNSIHNESPKFRPLLRLVTKEVDGKPSLSFYDKEAKGHIAVKKTEGVFVDKAMSLYVFDSRNSCSVQSTLFFNTKHTGTLYKKGEKVFAGTYHECKDYIKKEYSNPKTLQNFIIGTEQGYIIATTNIAVGIDDLNNLKNILKTDTVYFEAQVYNKKDESISNKTKEGFGALADKNPPKLVRLRRGRPITEFVENKDQNAIVDHIENFEEWRNYYLESAGSTPVKSESDIVAEIKQDAEIDVELDEEPPF